jgi:wobble nucleotide-excising tRNase
VYGSLVTSYCISGNSINTIFIASKEKERVKKEKERKKQQAEIKKSKILKLKEEIKAINKTMAGNDIFL